MPERLHVHVHHRQRGGCGGLLLFWLVLTLVYMLVGITGVWIVLGLGCALVIFAVLGLVVGK